MLSDKQAGPFKLDVESIMVAPAGQEPCSTEAISSWQVNNDGCVSESTSSSAVSCMT